jgi:hypothetical protein
MAGDRGADVDDAAHDLVAGHDGVLRDAPVVADHVQVGVADAAVEDLDGDVVGAERAALEVEGRERGVRRGSCVAVGLHASSRPDRGPRP